MDRYWLLTNTTYGARLPGDGRGFVGRVWDRRPGDPTEDPRVAHNVPGTPCDEDIPGLERASRELMCGPPIFFAVEHAVVVLDQFRETATFRRWELRAVAVMRDHFHIVAGVEGDPPPSKILGDFKSYGSRALTRRFGPPASETWWAGSGSKRKLPGDAARAAAEYYVLFEQFEPLVTWSPETGLHYGYPPARA